MKFTAAVMAVLAAVASAEVTLTNSDYDIEAGKPFTIEWTGADGPVTITLKNGDPTDLQTVEVIDCMSQRLLSQAAFPIGQLTMLHSFGLWQLLHLDPSQRPAHRHLRFRDRRQLWRPQLQPSVPVRGHCQPVQLCRCFLHRLRDCCLHLCLRDDCLRYRDYRLQRGQLHQRFYLWQLQLQLQLYRLQ